MREVGSNIIIFSYIRQTNENEISVDEIINYINYLRTTLKKTNYYFKDIDVREVVRITSMYPMICDYSNRKIIIKDCISSHNRIDKFFLNNISDELKSYLVKPEKFVFPILYENNIVLYNFHSNNKELNELKDKLYFDNIKSDGYILDLKSIDYSIKNKIISVILNEKVFSKDIVDYDKLIDFINYLEKLNNKKYREISQSFNISNDLSLVHSYYKFLNEYCLSANNNKEILSKDFKSLQRILTKF